VKRTHGGEEPKRTKTRSFSGETARKAARNRKRGRKEVEIKKAFN